jgi:hypothetical protein
MTEKRSHPRITEDAEVAVKIKSAPEVRNIEGKTFSCRTTDVSMRGVQLKSNVDIPIGTLLELDIIFKQTSKNYIHIGNVVWKTESSDDESEFEGEPYYNVGIRFNEVSNPQLRDWIKAVTNLLGDAEII